MKQVLAALAMALVSGVAAAQSHQPQAHQPYAGLEQREIKALSSQQIDDLTNGRGMSLALAAELNGYPGPIHVLELADRLGLTADQRTGVQKLFDSMKSETVPLGMKLLEQERHLDRLFAARSVTPQTLKTATSAVAETQGLLRESHLKYHLSTAAILTHSQMQQYSMLRGYGHQHGGTQQPH